MKSLIVDFAPYSSDTEFRIVRKVQCCECKEMKDIESFKKMGMSGHVFKRCYDCLKKLREKPKLENELKG